MAVSFDGSSSKIVGAMPGNSGDTTKCVSMWLKTNQTATRKFPFIMGNSTVNFQRMGVDAFGTALKYGVYTGSLGTGTTSISTGVWNHVFIQYISSQTACYLYLNGVQDSSIISQAVTFGTADLGIGGFPVGGSWNGMIAEVAIWDADFTPLVTSIKPNIDALAAGKSPRRVARQSLKFYAPLKTGSGIQDLKAALGLTVTAATSADHPRMYL